MSIALQGISLGDLATAASGELLGSDAEITSVSTDSRTVVSGDVYFCLTGEKFDGHDYVESALAAGAVAVVCQRQLECKVASDVAQVVVADTRQAFGLLAGLWRDSLDVQLIGVTGSNGKTTVKQILAAIAGTVGAVHSTRANDNNDIGVPQTLLGIADHHRFAVVEMGANQRGEIAWLGSIAKPDVAIITNVSESHLEGFGSLQDVANEKSAIYSSLKTSGTAVVNCDDRFAPGWLELNKNRSIVTFGGSSSADVYVEKTADCTIRLHCGLSAHKGSIEARFYLAGEHNLLNVAAAAAAALVCGITLPQIARAIATVEPVKGRLNFHYLDNDIAVIDDTYNANPASTRAAIEVLLSGPGEPWLVLADLKELGDDAVAHHTTIGEYAREKGVRRLFATGQLSRSAVSAFGPDAEWFDSREKLLVRLHQQLKSDTTILVKGSRSMSMDVVVESLLSGSHTRDAIVVGANI